MNKVIKDNDNPRQVQMVKEQLTMQKYIKCKDNDIANRFKRTINGLQVGWIIETRENGIHVKMADGPEKCFSPSRFNDRTL